MKRIVLLSIFGVLVIGGCKDKDQARGADFDSRFNAAMQISSTKERNDALVAVAVDAAESGKGQIVKKPIEKIASTSTKDKAAGEAAVKLAKAGQGSDAVEVANMISQTALRDDILAKIAK